MEGLGVVNGNMSSNGLLRVDWSRKRRLSPRNGATKWCGGCSGPRRSWRKE